MKRIVLLLLVAMLQGCGNPFNKENLKSNTENQVSTTKGTPEKGQEKKDKKKDTKEDTKEEKGKGGATQQKSDSTKSSDSAGVKKKKAEKEKTKAKAAEGETPQTAAEDQSKQSKYALGVGVLALLVGGAGLYFAMGNGKKQLTTADVESIVDRRLEWVKRDLENEFKQQNTANNPPSQRGLSSVPNRKASKGANGSEGMEPPKPKVLYARPSNWAGSLELGEVKDAYDVGKSLYKLMVDSPDGRTARITLALEDDAKKRILGHDRSLLKPICEVEEKRGNPMEVAVKKEGKARLNGEIWVVEDPIVIVIS